VLLNVSSVVKSFGPDEILRGVTFRVQRREKVAFLGRNGTGKTTLLKIINGEMEPDTGSVTLARGAKIGYLRQENAVDPNRTVLEEAQSGLKEVLLLKSKLEALEIRMENKPTPDDLDEYATLHEHFHELEGYSAERDVLTVLAKMGFEGDDLQKPSGKLSGGEKTRLALARLLLEAPDLLVLDEPTNHLDLQATEWLEGWLRGYPGAVLLVSHDRSFLTGLTDTVIELADGVVKSYPGPFEKYLELREAERARQTEVSKKQQIEIDKLDEYVRRFMNSQRTAQARGRLKQMEKLIAAKVDAPKNDKTMHTAFKASERSGDIVLDLQHITMGFGGETLFSNIDWTVRWGERWGMVGENGAGKSTLIKIALNLLMPVSGQTKMGSRVGVGYFAQDTVNLDPKQSPLDFLVYEYGLLPADARKLLGRFLFSGDDVFRPVNTLSGGEKNKLVLASLTTLNPNLLVLDEPTNHLDMDSREALAGVLKEYTGTLILISHDRWLLQQVTDHTLDLRRSGPIFFNGSYAEYHRRSTQKQVVYKGSTRPVVPEKPALSPREISKEIVRLSRLVFEIEEQIFEAEQSLKMVEAQLATPSDKLDILALTKEHGQLQSRVADRMAEWEKQSANLEELKIVQGAVAT